MPIAFKCFRAPINKLTQLTLLSFTLLLLANSGAPAVFAQETRGTILGTVRDSSGAVVPGASITVTNTGTNTSNEAVSSDGGTFEVPFLQPGTYNVTAQAQGFKRFVQQGVIVNVGSRANLEVTMDVGAVTEEVTITSAAPLLDTTSGSGSAVLDNQAMRNLPVFGNNALLTVRSLPGIQWTGQPNYLGLHSNQGSSAISAAGGAGGTEFILDGIPNTAGDRRAAFLPHSDAVQEIRVSSSEFDARQGHTVGAVVSMVTKSGTNEYHGSLSYLHWQQRFNATNSFTNAAYFQRINEAEASGNVALAERLRNEPRQTSGRSNTYAVNIGGPIYLPRFGEGGPSYFSGKDKLFFFFSYNGYKEAKSEEGTALNRTVPTEAHRRGDFSDLLRLGSRYQIFDPRTARCDNNQQPQNNNGQLSCPSGSRVIRTAFPNNQVPILNPFYNQVVRLLPLPNGNPASTDGYTSNYLASGTPFNWDYTAYQNRIDYNINDNQKLTGKWSWNSFLEDRGDWTYETARGLQSNGLVRDNFSIGLDYVLTLNPSTFLRFTAGFNRFITGSLQNATQLSYSPGSLGLPSYLDERAGNFQSLPFIDFSDNSYSDISRSYPGFTRFSVATTAGELSKTFSHHSVRVGYDLRQNYRASNNPGNSSGRFAFNNNYTRLSDDANRQPAALIGLEWAAFMLGVPSTVTVDTNDTLYLTNPFVGGYVQDDWRVNSKLTLNLGLRYEWEGGFRERFNRGIAQFDPNIQLPIEAAAETAYTAVYAADAARNPQIGLLTPSQFDVRGGTRYLGVDGYPRTLNNAKAAYMPRVGFAYQLNDQTVVRGGYGFFYDTNNVLNAGLNQFGFNRATNTLLTSNAGLTFDNTNLGFNSGTDQCSGSNIAGCQTIFNNPFPALSDGTRFREPLGNQLGSLARAGRGFDSFNRDWERSRQQRWRVGVQREITKNLVVEVAYLGSYTDNMGQTAGETDQADDNVFQRLDALPRQYFTTGLIRRDANAALLNATVTNPFQITTQNFAFLRTQNPAVYEDLASQGFFTSNTIARHRLLRPFSLFSAGDGLRLSREPDVALKYHHAEVSATQRFARGTIFTASYQWASSQVRDFRENEFDVETIYRQNTNYRPHSFRANAVLDLPFGKGRRFLSGGGFLSKLVGGWQASPIYFLQSGRVFGFGNLFYYGNDLREIKLPDSERTRENWFNWQIFPGAQRDYNRNNRAAYEARVRQIVPAEIIQTMQAQGNVCGEGRNQRCDYNTVIPTDFQPADFHARVFPSRFNWLRSDIMTQLDMNIQRTFPLTENVRLEFKTDFINLFNSVQWDTPNTDINSNNFGSVTQQWNTPRWIQFQFRLTF